MRRLWKREGAPRAASRSSAPSPAAPQQRQVRPPSPAAQRGARQAGPPPAEAPEGGAARRELGRSHLRRATAVLEARLEQAGDAAWHRLRRRPLVGVALSGGVGLALASVVGVSELVVGLVAAYGAYLMLAKGEPPSRALRDATRLGRDLPA